jgi:hypothetical protein
VPWMGAEGSKGPTRRIPAGAASNGRDSTFANGEAEGWSPFTSADVAQVTGWRAGLRT